jgi:hypothetical protein
MNTYALGVVKILFKLGTTSFDWFRGDHPTDGSCFSDSDDLLSISFKDAIFGYMMFSERHGVGIVVRYPPELFDEKAKFLQTKCHNVFIDTPNSYY